MLYLVLFYISVFNVLDFNNLPIIFIHLVRILVLVIKILHAVQNLNRLNFGVIYF